MGRLTDGPYRHIPGVKQAGGTSARRRCGDADPVRYHGRSGGRGEVSRHARGNAADLPAKASDHAKAALTEYLESYLGRRAFSRGGDILEHRLSLLVKHAFGGKIPTAAQVSDLFQTTLSSSRTLIRNTFSKYRFTLGTVADAAAREVLEKVVWADARCLQRPDYCSPFGRAAQSEAAVGRPGAQADLDCMTAMLTNLDAPRDTCSKSPVMRTRLWDMVSTF
jgi:hypothetical protein